MTDLTWDLDELTVAKDRFITNFKTRDYILALVDEIKTTELTNSVVLSIQLKNKLSYVYIVDFDLPIVTVYGKDKKILYKSEFPKKANILYRWFERDLELKLYE